MRPAPRIHPSGAALSLGALSGSRNTFRGFVAELDVWDRALAPEEVLWLSRHSVAGLGDGSR